MSVIKLSAFLTYFIEGSQFFDFYGSSDMVKNNLMHVSIDQRASKTIVIGIPVLQFGVRELWFHNEQHFLFLRDSENCRCTTSDTILFSESLMGINRCCS